MVSGSQLFVVFTLLRLAQGDSSATLSSPQAVINSAELLTALLNPLTSLIALADNVRFREEEVESFPLPVRIAANRSVTLTSASGDRRIVDFDRRLVLYLEPGSVMSFVNLKLTGALPAYMANETGLPTEVSQSPLWPSVDGGDEHKIVINNTVIHSNMTFSGCNPETVKILSERIMTQLGRSDTVFVSGTTIRVDDNFTVRFPILDIATKKSVGTVTFAYSNFTTTCTPNNFPTGPGAALPSSPPADAPPSEAGGGGSPAWTLPVIVVAVGTAVVAAGVLLVRLRVKRQRLHRQLDLAVEEGKASGTATATASRTGTGTGTGTSTETESFTVPAEEPLAAMIKAAGAGTDEAGARAAGSLGATLWNNRVGPIEGLELAELVGKGSFGNVYRGRWKGAVVAVKIIEHMVTIGKEHDVSREPLLSVSVSHPNVVATYKLSLFCVSPSSVADTPQDWASLDGRSMAHGASGQAGTTSASASTSAGASSAIVITAGSSTKSAAALSREPSELARVASCGSSLCEAASFNDSLRPGLYNTFLVMEYCDRGNLTDAILLGKFHDAGTRQLDLVPALLSLLDVAQGMEYLHSCKIIHGDLKGRNVLLKSARNDRRGFVCKLADFGLSRLLGNQQTHVDTRSLGTATHAAPELLECGILSAAADVYAFSMIMWEMVAGEEVFSDMIAVQIILQVTQHGYRPEIPAACPEPLAQLMQQCWSQDPLVRPAFEDITRELRTFLVSARASKN